MQTREPTSDRCFASVVPRIFVFVGGMGSRIGLSLLQRTLASLQTLTGTPYAFIFCDTAKEVAWNLLEGSAFYHIRPLDLARLARARRGELVSVAHLARDIGAFAGANVPGAGSNPVVGFLTALCYLPQLVQGILQEIGAVTNPQVEASVGEDTRRFSGRSLDTSKVYIDFIFGHGGTSSLAPFGIARALRCELERLGQSFHMTARLVLASATKALPVDLHPITYSSMAISLSSLEAVQRLCPGVSRDIVLLDGSTARGGSARLFDESILLGQAPSEYRSMIDFSHAVAECLYHETMTPAVIPITARRVDADATVSTRMIHKRGAHHAAIGYRVITPVPGDVRLRLPTLLRHAAVQLELDDSIDDLPPVLDGLRVPPVSDLPRIDVFPIATTTTVEQLRAHWTMLKKSADSLFAKETQSNDRAAAENIAVFQESFRRSLGDLPIAAQRAACISARSRIRDLRNDLERTLKAAARQVDDAESRLKRSLISPARTREWCDLYLAACAEYAAGRAVMPLSSWCAPLESLEQSLAARADRLGRVLSDLQDRLDPSLLPSNTRASLLSTGELMAEARSLIEAEGQRFRAAVSDETSAVHPADLLASSCERILDTLLDRLGDVPKCLAWLSRNTSVGARLAREIEAVQPLLTADVELMAGMQLHITTVVLLPLGALDALDRSDVDLGLLSGATVLEDRGRDVVILRAFRGYSMSVIPEVTEGVQHLVRWYRERSCKPSWLHVDDVPPMPVPLEPEEYDAALLLARIMSCNNGLRLRWKDGVIFYEEATSSGTSDVRLAADEEDLLAGTMRAISEARLDPKRVHARVTRWYAEHPAESPSERLLKVARHLSRKVSPNDFSTAWKIQTAISDHLQYGGASSGSERRNAFCSD